MVLGNNISFPQEFLNRYSSILSSNEFDVFLSSFYTKPKKCLKVNSLRSSPSSVSSFLSENNISFSPVPFCDSAFFIDSIPSSFSFGSSLSHNLGDFVLMDSSSLIPPLVLSPSSSSLTLDLAAAPGTKSFFLAELMNNFSSLVCVDINPSRVSSLRFNLSRLGIINSCSIVADASSFSSSVSFDKILLDAPCSSESFAKKNPALFKSWSLSLINKRAELQKSIISNAFSLLAPGGDLVYSVCSLAPEENEFVIQHLLDSFSNVSIEPIKVSNLIHSSAISSWNNISFDSSISKNCMRIYPHQNNSYGFFVAKISKSL